MRTRALVTCITVLGLAACGTAPKESFYTLAPSATPIPQGAPTANLAISVGPVVVPDAVDRTPMVLRTGPNSVEIEDFHRWAEPLRTAIPRVLAEDLMRELGTTRVLASRLTSMPVDYRVAVEIQRFDSSFTQGAAIDALWTVAPSRTGGVAKSGRTTVVEPAPTPDYAGVAAAHSRALARLAADIAAALR